MITFEIPLFLVILILGLAVWGTVTLAVLIWIELEDWQNTREQKRITEKFKRDWDERQRQIQEQVQQAEHESELRRQLNLAVLNAKYYTRSERDA